MELSAAMDRYDEVQEKLMEYEIERDETLKSMHLLKQLREKEREEWQ